MKKNTSFKAMLATISLLGIVPVAVNSFMNQSVVPFAKTSLEDVIKERTVKAEVANDAESVLLEIVKNNEGLTPIDIVISGFNKATEISSGSALISASEGSDYIGSVGITIDRLPKIELTTVITNTTVKGQSAPDQEKLLKQLEYGNPRLTVADVEIKNFQAATPLEEGSAIVVAQDGTKYTGEVVITLTKVPKIDLNDLIQIREVNGETANGEQAVLEELVKNNPALDIKDIDIDNFQAASTSASGSALIVAKEDTKYDGEVNIVITPIPKTALNTVITERTIEGAAANTAQEVKDEVARLNPALDANSVEVSNFTRATDITPGSAIISALVNGKYTGQVGITINPLTEAFKSSYSDAEDVVNAIHFTKFTKSVNVNGSSVDEVKASINATYIKDRLSEEIEGLFDDQSFQLKKIVKGNGSDLLDRDLASAKQILGKITYDYGTFKTQTAEIVITVKPIARSTDRDVLLRQIKAKADHDEDDNVWRDLWFSYFKQIESDTKQFSFEFPIEALESSQENKDKAIQSIIYDEIKLVMETDFKFWSIAKGYDPTSVEVIYTKFELSDEIDTYEFFAQGRVAIDIKAYGEFVRTSVRFNYNCNYTVV